jgi:hypothetical protein
LPQTLGLYDPPRRSGVAVGDRSSGGIDYTLPDRPAVPNETVRSRAGITLLGRPVFNQSRLPTASSTRRARGAAIRSKRGGRASCLRLCLRAGGFHSCSEFRPTPAWTARADVVGERDASGANVASESREPLATLDRGFRYGQERIIRYVIGLAPYAPIVESGRCGKLHVGTSKCMAVPGHLHRCSTHGTSGQRATHSGQRAPRAH